MNANTAIKATAVKTLLFRIVPDIMVSSLSVILPGNRIAFDAVLSGDPEQSMSASTNAHDDSAEVDGNYTKIQMQLP